MKVSELTGATLDHWVAKACGHQDQFAPGGTANDYRLFAPSTDWRDGGPIIDRERISVIGPAGALKEWQAHAKYTLLNAPERLATQ